MIPIVARINKHFVGICWSLGTCAYTHFVQLDLLIPNIYHMPIFDKVCVPLWSTRSPDLAENGTIRFTVLELVRVQIFVGLAFMVFL